MNRIFDFSSLFSALENTKLAPWLHSMPNVLEQALANGQHGKLPLWRQILDDLPHVSPTAVDLQTQVKIGLATDMNEGMRKKLAADMRLLMPWRKGPICLFGIEINTEWRSDWKWARFKDQIQPLDGRLVLDVGCGNGYFGWRMAGAGARLVLGLDPLLLYVMQHLACHHFLPHVPSYVLPLGIEALPADSGAFDTVFSMGVLYHRRSPFDHLLTLFSALRPGGELVLETLVIDGSVGQVLVPRGRYAMMRNVWFIPSINTLVTWLEKTNFQKIEVLDVTVTTPDEQRSTSWMKFQSLSDFLDPDDERLTIEGYPAPKRAIITASRR